MNETNDQSATDCNRLGSTLHEAAQLLTGSRQDDYGNPADTYARAAKMWSALTGIDITPEQGVYYMLCVKLIREAKRHKADNMVDAAAYASIVNYIAERDSP